MDFNANYGAVAYTYTNSIDSGVVTQNISTEIYDNAADQWLSAISYFESDTINTFLRPTVSISDNGLAALTFQTVNQYTDTIPDQGQLNLYVQNLVTPAPNWAPISNSTLQYLCDTSVYVWALDASFGNNDVLYVMTQEMDTIVGGTYIPTNGVTFGSSQLNQVMRAIQVYPNLTITDAPDPCSVPTGVLEHNEIKNPNAINISNYPNPFSTHTVFEYFVNTKALVTIEIYDLEGKLLETSLHQSLEIGTYKTAFENKNLANGVYMCKITIGNKVAINRMVIAK